MLVREIAELADVPAPFLAKLVHILGRKGVVETQRGIGGGVVLVGKPETISLYDLCEFFDDPILKDRCMLSNAVCSDERACACHKFWMKHRGREIEYLKRTTIAQLAKFEARAISTIARTDDT